MSTIRIQECAGDIDNVFASPFQNQTWIFCNLCYTYCFQVFFCCISKHLVYVFFIYYNCHTFLRLGNSKFCSIQARIFLWHFIKIYNQAICQLTNGNRYTAGSKVVTFLDQAADFFSAEQTLDLTFCRCITFLNFSTAGINGFGIVSFGRTGCSTTAISTGTSTQKDNDVTRI